MKEENIPQYIVSIVVVVYNSSEFIIDVLESIKAQTHKNIELIVSDDCSIDNTVEICNEWVAKNKSRFIRSEVITSPINTGVAENANRGLYIAKGEWLKLIAGDDALENDCIDEYLKFVNNNSNIKVAQSNSKYYKNNFSNSSYIRTRKINSEVMMKKPYSVNFQRKVLIFSPSVNAPTLFINRTYMESIGYFDSRISYMDDWPLWIKINNSKTIIYGLDKDTVKYRVRSGSLSNDGSYVNSNFEGIYRYQREYLWTELVLLDKLFIKYEYLIKKTWIKLRVNVSIYFLKLVYIILISPTNLYNKIRIRYYFLKYRKDRGLY